jgi:hypothetical protein
MDLINISKSCLKLWLDYQIFYIFSHDFLYVLLILIKFLNTTKIDRNMSDLRQIVFKYIILTLVHFGFYYMNCLLMH